MRLFRPHLALRRGYLSAPEYPGDVASAAAFPDIFVSVQVTGPEMIFLRPQLGREAISSRRPSVADTGSGPWPASPITYMEIRSGLVPKWVADRLNGRRDDTAG